MVCPMSYTRHSTYCNQNTQTGSDSSSKSGEDYTQNCNIGYEKGNLISNYMGILKKKISLGQLVDDHKSP